MHSIYGVIKESIKFSVYYHSAFFNTVYNGKLVLEWDTARRKKFHENTKYPGLKVTTFYQENSKNTESVLR